MPASKRDAHEVLRHGETTLIPVIHVKNPFAAQTDAGIIALLESSEETMDSGFSLRRDCLKIPEGPARLDTKSTVSLSAVQATGNSFPSLCVSCLLAERCTGAGLEVRDMHATLCQLVCGRTVCHPSSRSNSIYGEPRPMRQLSRFSLRFSRRGVDPLLPKVAAPKIEVGFILCVNDSSTGEPFEISGPS